MLGRERIERPLRRASRDDVEAFGFLDAAGDFVVVAADDRGRREAPHALDDGVRVGAVPDQISEHEHFLVSDVRPHRPGTSRALRDSRGCR